jgi:hypothetical protein
MPDTLRFRVDPGLVLTKNKRIIFAFGGDTIIDQIIEKFDINS